jgi:hypothetical protein
MSELNCLIYNSCNRSEDPSSISFSFFFDDKYVNFLITRERVKKEKQNLYHY